MPVALLLMSSGCYVQGTGGITYARGHIRGGAAELVVGDDGLRLVALQVSAQHVERSDRETTAVALDEGLRGSLPGALFPDRDWARWFDFGGDAGAGVGADGEGLLARAWAGVWADVRLSTRHDEYPTLRAQIRRVAYTGNVHDESELFFGIGWTVRGANTRVPD